MPAITVAPSSSSLTSSFFFSSNFERSFSSSLENTTLSVSSTTSSVSSSSAKVSTICRLPASLSASITALAIISTNKEIARIASSLPGIG